MEPTTQATLRVFWDGAETPEDIQLQFNPTEISFDKSAQLAEISIPGLDSPLLQFVRGQDERLTMDLFFDTTAEDNLNIDSIYSLITGMLVMFEKIARRHN